MKNWTLGRLTRISLLAAALSTNSVPSLQAHPGHPLGDHGVAHVVASPYHLALLAGVGAALWLSARLVQRRFPKRLMQIGGATAVLSAFVLLGLRP